MRNRRGAAEPEYMTARPYESAVDHRSGGGPTRRRASLATESHGLAKRRAPTPKRLVVKYLSRSGGTGIRVGLKNRSSYEVEGSTPSFGMILSSETHLRCCLVVRLCDAISIASPRSLLRASYLGFRRQNHNFGSRIGAALRNVGDDSHLCDCFVADPKNYH